MQQAMPDGPWHPERSFANPLGFGGKVDLHNDEWVIDVKTKDGDACDIYDEHLMQLAAYRLGLRLANARCAVLFVNRNEPRAVLRGVTEEELKKGMKMFMGLLDFWRAKNNYFPTWGSE
jgi:hypothetical protein